MSGRMSNDLIQRYHQKTSQCLSPVSPVCWTTRFPISLVVIDRTGPTILRLENYEIAAVLKQKIAELQNSLPPTPPTSADQ